MASNQSMTADQVRDSFTGFFSDRGHTVVPSASLIPHDPTLMFNVAGMVPFKSYFVGDEQAPYNRAVSSQKCARAGGKHNDLDDVGRTKRHLVFFEMLGNFSFGDYFKSDAIPWSWELMTSDAGWGFDGDQLWVTVHESDDEAEAIWHEEVGVPMNRIQRLGDKDNYWQMGDTGPCGPCSEIHIDRGATFGPDGGPLHDPGGDRFMEIWNLVFMQFNQAADGSRTPLPKPSIDTGAGLERILTLKQGVDSVWETDLMMPMIEQAQSLTGKSYKVGDYNDRDSFGLRVLAEHARSGAMLVNDGVFPSNEARGYVLRRIIRRAVRFAYMLGTDKLVMPSLTETAISVMGDAYPDLVKNQDFITNVITREEESFRHTLKNGLGILDTALEDDSSGVPGSTAFLLHDTYGFPVELTQEIASERDVKVDIDGFNTEMNEQRSRAKAAAKGAVDDATLGQYREVVDQFGTTEFVGYSDNSSSSHVLAVLASTDDKRGEGLVEIFLDQTPFYAESGGQVGDTGTIVTKSGTAEVLDCTFAIPNLRRHVARIIDGTVTAGQTATASIDVDRRDKIRRNHTGTHLLHDALRRVLGAHVKQAGSWVGPDRLRFDFSHYEALTPEQIGEIEAIANTQTLHSRATRNFETTKDEAEALGAIAFFGDKYGDIVRVLEAGDTIELCGGTHVASTGEIGIVKVISEASIGSNLRRIEAFTGQGSVALLQRDEQLLGDVAELVGTQSDDVLGGVQRKLDEIKSLQSEIKGLRTQVALGRATELAQIANDGVVVAQTNQLDPGEVRELALAVRQQPNVNIVVLVGETPSGGVALVAAVPKDSKQPASVLLKDAAKAVGGGGGGKGDIATAGGKNPAGIAEALQIAAGAIGNFS
ncbi:MAG: alanyl-tRNA synthetase [Ilumatobacter sp.]|jgi:alanyl-tRNA synthetase